MLARISAAAVHLAGCSLPASSYRCSVSLSSTFNACPMASTTSVVMPMSPAFYSQLYQVTPTLASTGTSSHRRPAVRRRLLVGRPTSVGRSCSRRARRNCARLWRRASDSSERSSDSAGVCHRCHARCLTNMPGWFGCGAWCLCPAVTATASVRSAIGTGSNLNRKITRARHGYCEKVATHQTMVSGGLPSPAPQCNISSPVASRYLLADMGTSWI